MDSQWREQPVQQEQDDAYEPTQNERQIGGGVTVFLAVDKGGANTELSEDIEHGDYKQRHANQPEFGRCEYARQHQGRDE